MQSRKQRGRATVALTALLLRHVSGDSALLTLERL